MLLVTPPRPLCPSRVPLSSLEPRGTLADLLYRLFCAQGHGATVTPAADPAARDSHTRSQQQHGRQRVTAALQPALPAPSPWAGAAGVGTGGRGLTAQYTTVQPQNGMDSRLCRQSRIISSPKIILSWMGVWVGRVILMNVSKMENSGCGRG